MNKLTILVDCDDVMNNLCEVWVGELNRVYGTSVKHDAIQEWDMTKAFPTLTPKQVYLPLFWESLWSKVKPKSGAIKGMKNLIDKGHDVYIVTASHPSVVGIKVHRFIDRYFGFIPHDKIIVSSNKKMIVGDILIDDAPHNHGGHQKHGILFSAPHNASFDVASSGLYRANDWDDVLRLIEKIDLR